MRKIRWARVMRLPFGARKSINRRVGSIPLESAELVEVQVPARQDHRDARAGRKLDEPVEQGGDRRRGRPLDDELAALHDPDHRIEDLSIRKRDDLVDESLNDGEV